MENDIYGELINCDEMHSSVVEQDDVESYSAGIPEYLAPLAEITHDNASAPNKRYYDGKVRFINIVDGDAKVNITVSGIPCKLAAQLTGKAYDEKTGRFYDTGDTVAVPWRTLSGRMELGDGGYRYYQYLKGKFSIGAQTAHTREDNITVGTTSLTYTPAVTEHKFQVGDKITGARAVFADTTDAAFTTEEQNTWFDKVQTPPEVAATTSEAAQASNDEGAEE